MIRIAKPNGINRKAMISSRVGGNVRGVAKVLTSRKALITANTTAGQQLLQHRPNRLSDVFFASFVNWHPSMYLYGLLIQKGTV